MRYRVREVPYGNTPSPDINAPFTVVDTTPQCETFTTKTGAELTEETPPAWRNVAFCMKRGHAEMVASALNKEAHPLLMVQAGVTPSPVWNSSLSTPPDNVRPLSPAKRTTDV